ncbi:MAG: DUF63 family protein [Methanobacteriota archaeon]|nr:MAG: DUF63 family protein [Euryarchaeota archaeon]
MAVYTPLDYAVGFAILLVIMWLSERYLFTRIALDRYFLYAAAPVAVFTIAVRLLADAGVYGMSELWSVTPGIYVTGTLFGAFLIAVGVAVERVRGIPYWKTAVLTGTPVAAYFSYRLLLELEKPFLPLQPLILALILTTTIYILSNFTASTRLFRKVENVAIIFAHMLDGASTYIGVDRYGFIEEHLLPDMLVRATGTAAVMIPLKIVLVLGALYLLEKWRDEEEGSDLYYKMIKFLLFIFGFGPGTRNSLLLALPR